MKSTLKLLTLCVSATALAVAFHPREPVDENNYVFAGSIPSPDNAQPLAERAVKWIISL